MRVITWFCLLFTLTVTLSDAHGGCGTYGQKPCTYVPAPPGKTPHCARPGLTYCEFPENYPKQLIHFLIEKWRYDHTTLISDESTEDFTSYIYPPKTEYGPPGYHSFGPNVINPEPIHIPKPDNPLSFTEGRNAYIPPRQNDQVYQTQLRNGQFFTSKFPNNFPNVQRPNYNGYYDSYQNFVPYSDQLYKRKSDNQYRLKRSLKFKRALQILDKNFENISSNKTLFLERKRRQATLNGEPLCQTRSQYITPRAALNKDGNWMYVVNMPEVNDRKYTQMVKSEQCASTACSSLCTLPLGYSSRCEQKYIQKRLVALEGGGNNLYTDLFWFPSCCVCTLSNS